MQHDDDPIIFHHDDDDNESEKSTSNEGLLYFDVLFVNNLVKSLYGNQGKACTCIFAFVISSLSLCELQCDNL